MQRVTNYKQVMCREFNYEQVTLKRVQQLSSHPVDFMSDQLQINHPVESSVTNKSPWKELNYEQITL